MEDTGSNPTRCHFSCPLPSSSPSHFLSHSSLHYRLKAQKAPKKSFICSLLPHTLDPMQFCIPVQQVYRRCHRPDHAHRPHPPGQREYIQYVRMLFIDYSSAFNTIIRSRLVSKLVYLGPSTPPMQMDLRLPDGEA